MGWNELGDSSAEHLLIWDSAGRFNLYALAALFENRGKDLPAPAIPGSGLPSPNHLSVAAADYHVSGRIAVAGSDSLWFADLRLEKTWEIPVPWAAPVKEIVFAGNGSIVLAGSRHGGYQVFSFPDGNIVLQLPAYPALFYQIPKVSPSGRLIAWFENAAAGCDLFLWDASRPQAQPRKVATGVRPDGIAFSDDEALIVFGSPAGPVSVWRASDLSPAGMVARHILGSRIPGFSSDGQRLVTVSSGKVAVKLWNLADWKEVLSLDAVDAHPVKALFTTDDRWLLGLPLFDSGILAWHAPRLEDVEEIESRRGGWRDTWPSGPAPQKGAFNRAR